RAQYLAPMILVLHVDEVDDDDAADVAQAQLPGDGRGGLEVGLEDGLFEGAMPDEGAGIDVDGGHRLRRVDDQVAPGLEHHLALQRLLDFVLDAVQVEDRPLARVMLQTIAQLGHQFADELLDLLEILPRVDADLLDTWVDQVAQRAHGQRQVFIDQRGCAHRLHLPVDLLPQPAQVADVHEDLVPARAFGSGAQDEATGFLDAFGGDAFGHHLLETLALGLVLDTQGNPDVAGSRHVDQVARRNRQLRGQPRALGADGVLGHLHHQALPIVYQRADGLDRVALAGGNFRGMDEGRALQADVDE